MTDLNMQLVLRLIDRATGPAKAALQKVERAGAAMERSGNRNIALADRMAEKNRARSAAIQGETAQVIGLGAAFWALTEPAIQAEARMAEVGKTVEFANKNGLDKLKRDIQVLVTDQGLDAKAGQIMDIVAAAGRLGVVDKSLPDAEKREAYIAFATQAAKVSRAFGVSAEDAAISMARWRNNLGLSAEQSLLLADRVNFLGNSYGTTEAAILKVMKDQAAYAKQAGLTTHETAALTTALLDAGVAPAVAGTGMKNFLRVLTQGESVTDRQRKAFEELGIAPGKLAKAMQEDATPAIFSVLEALEGVEAHRKGAIVGQLFGQESVEAISQLLGSTDRYREIVEATADANAMLGLTEEEYKRQADTTAAARRRLFNYLERTAEVIGSNLLPMLNELMETIMPVIGQVTAWAAQNPELIEQLGWIAAGLFGFKLGLLALRFAFGPFLSIAAAAVRNFGRLQLAFAALTRLRPLRLASLVRPLKWGAKLIPKLTKPLWIATAVGSKLAVSALFAPIKWGAKLIPKLTKSLWIATAVNSKLAVSALLKPLKWAKAGLIQTITTAMWIAQAGGKFALTKLVAPLKWSAALLPNFAPALARFVKFRIAATAQMARLSAASAWHSALIGGSFAAGLKKFLLRGGAIGTGIGLGLGIKPVENGELTPEAEAFDPTQENLDKARRDAVTRQKAEEAEDASPVMDFLDRLGLVTPAPAPKGNIPPPDAAQLPADDATRAAARTVQQAAARDILPPERLDNLRTEAAALRGEIAALEEELAQPKGPGDFLAFAETKDKLDAKKEELATLQAEIDRTKARSDKLRRALQLLAGTTVAPEINSASIDRALEKVRRLSQGLRSLPDGTATGAAPGRAGAPAAGAAEDKPEGARALGGAVRAGFTYRVNELGEELFTPGTNGRVTPAREAAPLIAAAAAFGGRPLDVGALPARAAAVLTAAGLGLAAPGAEAAGTAPAIAAGRGLEDRTPAVRVIAPEAGTRAAPGTRDNARPAAPARSLTMTVGDIHVHAASGQSPEAIARAVMERIERARRRGDDALHDGGQYD